MTEPIFSRPPSPDYDEGWERTFKPKTCETCRYGTGKTHEKCRTAIEYDGKKCSNWEAKDG
jgi:hypothetical protein